MPNFANALLLAQIGENTEAISLFPEWETSWIIFVSVISGLLVVLACVTYTTQAGVISRATTKEAVRQPVFFLLLFVGLIVLVVNTFVPFFTMGEDVKMLKECGLATLLVCGAALAVWTASTSIASEIEGKTAMTLLSKPINRRQFVLGKFMGIITAILWLLIPLVAAFLGLIYYKTGYDAKESVAEIPKMYQRIGAMLQILPAIFLIVCEIAVICAVSVALSTRLPFLVNIVTCVAIFVVGHLSPILVQQGVLKVEFVDFMAKLIATVLPSLEVFNVQASVATGTIVPAQYLGLSLVYCLCYCGVALLLGFIMFEDRDLA